MTANTIFIGKNQAGLDICLNAAMANRHGLIAGATGTGKTVTLQVLAEAFSRRGVPVFAADVKGDLSGLAGVGKSSPKLSERLTTLGKGDHQFEASPVTFFDLLQKRGVPLRTTVSEVGPLLLAAMLECNDTQTGVLQVAFRMADDEGLLLLDLKDLTAVLTFMLENRAEIQSRYGSVASQSIGAIQRRILVLEENRGDLFFGEPALKISHLLKKESGGRGIINLLDARDLINNSDLYASFLLWLLSELFEELPEKGDSDLPELVFFFDEAHLLFKLKDKALLEKVETVVRLIRSRGVGIFFVTQHPQDIPESVLGQLGNRIQHALRAFTPNEQAFVRIAAKSFRPNPELDVERVITELKVGEALVSVLDEDGVPSVVERTLVCPPHSKIGAVEEEVRKECMENSLLVDLYAETVDRESAYELLQKRAKENAEKAAEKEAEKKVRKSNRQSPFEAFIKSVLRSAGNQIGRQLFRGLLGSLKR